VFSFSLQSLDSLGGNDFFKRQLISLAKYHRQPHRSRQHLVNLHEQDK